MNWNIFEICTTVFTHKADDIHDQLNYPERDFNPENISEWERQENPVRHYLTRLATQQSINQC